MVESDFLLNALLCENYLPTTRRAKEELPPFFSTKKFSPAVARELIKLKCRKGNFSGYDQMEYRLTRFNGVSRLLSVPHPYPYANLSLALHENWEKLEYIVKNDNSKIKPQAYTDGRVIIMNGYNDSVEKSNLQLDESFGMRYRVRTDIANCFPSIYSHAVSWALVGFNEAKAKRGREFSLEWFNQIDKHIRSCKRDETQGISIGPATSNIVAEAILARIDEKLLKEKFRFNRHIDDYCCYCETEERAQEFVRIIEREAANFKLQLNIKKTDLSRLPQAVTDSWVVELSKYAPDNNEYSAFDAFRYLDYAVSQTGNYPDSSIIKYASGVILRSKIAVNDEAEILNYMLTLAFYHPEILPMLSGLIEAGYLNFGDCFFDMYGSTEKLNKIAQENALLNRSDGMSWSLFHLGRMKANITDATASAVVQTKDAFSILSLYWAGESHRDLVIDFSASLDRNDLYELDRYWMLLFQLFCDGHIDNPYADQIFDTLNRFDVCFLLPKSDFMPKNSEISDGDEK